MHGYLPPHRQLHKCTRPRLQATTLGQPEFVNLEGIEHRKESLKVVSMGMGHEHLLDMTHTKTTQSG
jgi:hypothetical protein